MNTRVGRGRGPDSGKPHAAALEEPAFWIQQHPERSVEDKTDNHKYSLEFHTLSWRAQRRKKAAQAIEGLRRDLYGGYR